MVATTEINASTLAADVAAAFPVSINGRVILITGVSPKSVGLATALALAAQKPKHLILTGRLTKFKHQSADLKSQYPEVKYSALIMNLSSQESVRAAASQLNSDPDIAIINILINNAGIMDVQDLTLSKDSIEISFATNHIGHFLFTNLIMKKLISASEYFNHPARIVNLTSFGHQFSPIRFSDINFSKTASELPAEECPELQKVQFLYGRDWSSIPYAGMFSHGQAKTANILFSISLNRKLIQYGIKSYAVHPGGVDTNIGTHSNPAEVQYAIAKSKELGYSAGSKAREQGANSSVWAAVNPEMPPVDFAETLVKGVYITDCRVADDDCADFARNADYAERLWTLSENLVQETFL